MKEEDKTIYLYGDGIGRVHYIDHMGTDATICRAARVSFGRDSDGDEISEKDRKLIKYLIKNKHTSTLEHCSVTFKFVVPLYVRSQHHRHRTWCVSGDTEITFNRPDRWKKGIHTKQTGNKGAKFTIKRLLENWENPVFRKKIEKMLVRVYDEKSKIFTVANIADVLYSGKKDVYEVTLDDGKKLKITKDHRILTKSGWQTLEEAVGLSETANSIATMSKDSYFLTNGTEDKGGSLSGIYSKVVSIEKIGIEDVYDLSIAGENHNFIANGIVVHNCFNEVSRRYTSENVQFYNPKFIRKQDISDKQASKIETQVDANYADFNDWFYDDGTIITKPCEDEDVRGFTHQYHEFALAYYNELLKRGVCREQARGVLPQNMYTEYYGTASLLNILKFIDLRLDSHAQWEIQQPAKAALDILEKLYPVAIQSYKELRPEEKKM